MEVDWGGCGPESMCPGPLEMCPPLEMFLFGGPKLLGGPRTLGLPQVARDGESVHAHRHGFGRDGGELLAVRAVFVDRLYHGGADYPGADAREPYHLLCLGIHGVHRPELAAGVSEQDQEVVGWALLHFLMEGVKEEKEGERGKWDCKTCSESGRVHVDSVTGRVVDLKGSDLYNLVFLWFVDLASQAAAGNGIVDDELVGLEARLLVELWP